MKYFTVIILMLILPIVMIGQSDSTSVDIITETTGIAVKKSTLVAFALAIAIMVAGFYLVTMINYLNKNKFEKTFTKQRLAITFSIMVLIGWLLVYQPDLAEALKSITGLDCNIESSKAAFLTLGVAMNKLMARPIEKDVEEIKKED